MKERVLAIVVTYSPDCQSLGLALNALEQQGCDTLIVDNGSSNLAEIERSIVGLSSTIVMPQEANLGLGAAHNIGIRHAQREGYDYLLILDQDSVPLDDMVANLVRAHKAKSECSKQSNLQAHKPISAVGVTYLNADNGSQSFFVHFGWLKFIRRYCADRDGNDCIEADFLISSGSLFSVSAIDTIGLMDEGLFIDHVDTEWFLRAKHKGFKAYGVCNAVMQHGLGESTHKVPVGGRQRNVPQHKPFRYYYIFRNSVLLYKRGYSSWLWKWNDVQRLAIIAVMFGILTPPRWSNLRMMLKGIWHGLLGRQGQLASKSEVNDG